MFSCAKRALNTVLSRLCAAGGGGRREYDCYPQGHKGYAAAGCLQVALGREQGERSRRAFRFPRDAHPHFRAYRTFHQGSGRNHGHRQQGNVHLPRQGEPQYDSAPRRDGWRCARIHRKRACAAGTADESVLSGVGVPLRTSPERQTARTSPVRSRAVRKRASRRGCGGHRACAHLSYVRGA